jgi:hypothetical protein
VGEDPELFESLFSSQIINALLTIDAILYLNSKKLDDLSVQIMFNIISSEQKLY